MSNQGFPAGTLVHTDKGLVPIQEIKVGDMVLSRPELGGRDAPTEYKRVLRTFCLGENIIYRILYIDNAENYIDGDKIKTKAIFISENHKVWVEENNEWSAIYHLKEYEMTLSSLNSNKNYTVVSAYPVFEIETSELNLNHLKTLSPFLKIGHCTQENLRPDIDAILISDIDELAVHHFENWGEIYDISYEIKMISTDFFEIINKLETNTSTNFFKNKVYAIEVEDYHTYFVGKDGIWVHNANFIKT